MAKIRFGYSDDFTAKNSGVGINTTDPQENLDVDGVVKGQDLKVTGISLQTGYEGFLRADHRIEEETQLNFGQGINASLSGEIIIGTGKTVTVTENLKKDRFGPELITNGQFLSNVDDWTAFNSSNSFNNGRLRITRSGGDGRGTYQLITNLVPGETYFASAIVDSIGSRGDFRIVNGNSWTSNYYLTRSGTNGQVKLLSGSFTATGTTALVGFAIDDNSTLIEVDQVTVRRVNDVEEPGTNVAGGSQIECMKVYNTFTPPSGGINDRPYKPKPGQLYYNYDLKTIEFHDGYGWRQVDYTTTSSRAVFGGGYAPGPSYAKQSSMSYVNIASTGNALDFGSLVANARTDHGAFSSSIRGVFHQSIGTPDTGESLDYVALASGGQAVDFGNLNTARTRTSGLSNSTRGFIAGGYTHPARIFKIDYVEIATVGNALEFGELSSHGLRPAPIASPTRGIFVGGTPAAASPTALRTDEITFVTIASKGNSIDFGGRALFAGAYGAGGVSNGVRGVYAGGDNAGGKEKTIGYLNLASTGNSQYFGDLSIAGSHHCGTSNHIRGIFNSSDQAPNTAVYTNAIEYVTISTAGNSIDFGDDVLSAGRRACTSDSHGGLGGF